MSRERLAAAAVCGVLALALSGCGVQPTGVNVAVPTAITVEQSSPSSAVTPSGPLFPARLFLTTKTGALVAVTRQISTKVNDSELVRQLAAPATTEESNDLLFSVVPPDTTIQATGVLAHEYNVRSVKPLSATALSQIACTLDVYWLLHPTAGLQASTKLIAQGVPNPKFDDCTSYAPIAANEAAAFPSQVSVTSPAPGGKVQPSIGPTAKTP
jgi:hypothetical protein